jgi:hypothetical protein
MPTVEEVLRQSGFTDQQISEMDQRAITAFSGVLSAAEAERQRAEVERQANASFYDNQIVPALTGWDEEKQRLENEKARVAAEAAFYRTQAQEARNAGFIAQDAPTFQPPRDGQGRYVANAGGTPGSPVFQPQEVIKRAGDGLAQIADVDWKHRSLFDGKPLPISPSELIRQADAHNMSPMIYADRTFGFTQREQELQKQQQEAHDNKIKQDAVAERDKYWAEVTGSNPDIRRPQANVRMTEVAKAVRSGAALPGAPGGKLTDPLLLNEHERRMQTKAGIQAELVEAER